MQISYNGKTRHVTMEIGWLRWANKRGLLNKVIKVKGRYLTNPEIVELCDELENQGHKYVPCCKNFDKKKGCLGVKDE